MVFGFRVLGLWTNLRSRKETVHKPGCQHAKAYYTAVVHGTLAPMWEPLAIRPTVSD